MKLKHVKAASWQMDMMLNMRPGDLAGNAALLLKIVKRFAAEGERDIVVPENFLRGGDCGSLERHAAFRAAEEKALAKVVQAVRKIRRAPRLHFEGAIEAALIPPGPDPRFPFGGNPEAVFSRQVSGLMRRLLAIGCRDVVIGLSGGLDSALALLVSVAAFMLLGYDSAGIHVLTMPGFGTTKRTRGNADRLCEGLGLALTTIDITPACRRHFKDIGHDETRHDVTFENAQARMRTMILMDKANQCGGIVIGTGDMSEIALGWCTYNGDHMSMFGVNAGVPKTTVREVCTWWAEQFGGLAGEALLDIVATPVSPELLPTAPDGTIAQRTEDRIGPYELHDFFLWQFVAEQKGKKEILAAAKRVFKGVYPVAAIRKWLDVFFRRFFAQAFKRNCAPDGVPVFSVYLSPSAWHVPSESSGSWL
ncbi:MAG: NAD(+) synthase [Kiritimatiellia bacterium]